MKRRWRFEEAVTEGKILGKNCGGWWLVGQMQEDAKPRYALGIGGSFNPVHVCHIRMLAFARTVVEQVAGGDVVAGFLAVALDNHVQAKTGMAMKSHHRLQMAHLAAQELPWVRQTQRTYSSSRMCVKMEMEGDADGRPCHAVEVWGGDYLDYFVHRGGGLKVDERAPLQAIVFGRKGYTDDARKAFLKNKTRMADVYWIQRPTILFVDWAHDVSSTAVRESLKLLHTTEDESERARVLSKLVESEQLSQAVADYIVLHERSLYIPQQNKRINF